MYLLHKRHEALKMFQDYKLEVEGTIGKKNKAITLGWREENTYQNSFQTFAVRMELNICLACPMHLNKMELQREETKLF